jgi:hypothetical protein
MSSNCTSEELKIEDNWKDLYFFNIQPIEGDINKQEEVVFNVLSNIGFVSVDLYDELRSLVTKIRLKYNNNVSYHNFYHCLHVFTSMNYLINEVNNNLLQKNDNSSMITPQEKFVLLYSALIHDIDHEGVFNTFLNKEGHKLSLLYDNRSVAEKRSISLGLDLISDYDILKDKSREIKRSIEKSIFDIVLSTDIADADRRTLTSTVINKGFEKESKLDLTTEDGRLSLFFILIKCSDLSSSIQSFETTYLMAKRLFYEHHNAFKTSRGDAVERDRYVEL